MGDKRTITRRSFLEAAAAIGALGASTCMLSSCATKDAEERDAFTASGDGKKLEAVYDPKDDSLSINPDVVVRYGCCIGCYSMCGNSLKIDKSSGEVLGEGGNPYNPSCAYPYLDTTEPLTEAYRTAVQCPDKKTAVATVCARSQAALQTYSQPDRITMPLKRAGKRGEGKWKPISWDQLIQEVCDGGKLFEEIGEDTEIEGFKALKSDEFLVKDSPEFGTKANGLVFFGGRDDGRSVMGARFCKAVGTANRYSHHSSCYGAAGIQTARDGGDNLSIDTEYAEYAIWCGTFPGANGDMQTDMKRVIPALQSGDMKIDVFDPSLGSGVVTPTMDNATWYPIKAATNPALGLGMLRWIIEHEAYNADYLAAPNYAAARALGFNSCTDASYLIICDQSHERFGQPMRPEDAGLELSTADNDFDDQFVVIEKGTGAATVNLDATQGAINFEGEVNGIKVRTAFCYLRDAAREMSIRECSEICGVSVETIERISKEFTSHGTKACINGMGGSNSLNGADSATMFIVLNALIGSIGMKGGLLAKGIEFKSSDDGERYLLSTIKGKPTQTAKAKIDRESFAWTDTSEYARRVAAGETDPQPLLPWYPLDDIGNSDNQTLMSIANSYPYRPAIILSWMCDTLKATPGGMREDIIEKLKDPEVVPLHIACDVFEGTHAHLADYIVPDTVPEESWGVQGHATWWPHKGTFLRWQSYEPHSLDLGDERHACLETFLCDVAERCGFPGFGEQAIPSKDGSEMLPLRDAPDYFLKAFANLAYDEGEPVPEISEDEIAIQALDELPESWKQCVTDDEWRRVLYVISRGGRTASAEDTFDEAGRDVYNKPYLARFYSDRRASYKNAFTGEACPAVFGWRPERFSDGTPIEEVYSREEFPFSYNSFKPRFRSVSMLSNSEVMREIAPTNYVEMNAEDAAELGISDGDEVRVETPSGDVMYGPAMLRDGVVRKGFAAAFGYGQIAYGSSEMRIGDEVRAGNPDIARGINVAQMQDPTISNAIFPIAEPEAGTPGRNGGMFKITKAER